MSYELIIFNVVVFSQCLPVAAYLLITNRLLGLLQKQYPEKWEELGRPVVNNVALKSTVSFLKFAWSKQATSFSEPMFSRTLLWWRISAFTSAMMMLGFSLAMLWAALNRVGYLS